jgi:hypothetical protein
MAYYPTNTSYLMVKKETTAGTPVIPNVTIPLFSESLVTQMNHVQITNMVGLRDMVYKVVTGKRNHSGQLTVRAEPNTANHLFSMILARGNVSGSGPYTWPFTLGASDSYTIGLLKGPAEFRYWGVKASQLQPNLVEGNLLQFQLTVAALGSFTFREVSSVTGTGPTTITLKTNYDAIPNKGLVVGDVIEALDVSTGNLLTGTVTAVNANGTQLTVSQNLSVLTSGDILYIKAQTPSPSLLGDLLWSRTEFREADTAASALTAAAQNVLEGSNWVLTHELNNDTGEQFAGSADPSVLIHTQGKIELNISRNLTDGLEQNRFLTRTNRAFVIRHFVDTGYEIRVTVNSAVPLTDEIALNTGEVVKADQSFVGEYNTSDAQAFDIKVLNNLSSM